MTGRPGLQYKLSPAIPLAFFLKLDSSESKQGEALSLGQGDRNQSSKQLRRQDFVGRGWVTIEGGVRHTVNSETLSFLPDLASVGLQGLEEELLESWNQNWDLTGIWWPLQSDQPQGREFVKYLYY